MKKIISITLVFIFLTVIAYAFLSSAPGKKLRSLYFTSPPKKSALHSETLKKLQTKAIAARSFVEKNNYNNRICFLIDLSIPSNQNRFFVFDFADDSTRNSGLVTHGRCNQSWLEGRKYGNTVGCGCSSLGKYKIGKPYNGRFGLAYKLFGLDKTNDKAFDRFVVLHAHECVPGTEVKNEICQSDGCPTVSPGFLQQLKPIIERSSKPVLLWIFE